MTFRRIAVYGWITGILSGHGGQGVARMRVRKAAYVLAASLYQYLVRWISVGRSVLDANNYFCGHEQP